MTYISQSCNFGKHHQDCLMDLHDTWDTCRSSDQYFLGMALITGFGQCELLWFEFQDTGAPR